MYKFCRKSYNRIPFSDPRFSRYGISPVVVFCCINTYTVMLCKGIIPSFPNQGKSMLSCILCDLYLILNFAYQLFIANPWFSLLLFCRSIASNRRLFLRTFQIYFQCLLHFRYFFSTQFISLI